jgi:DNA uptake protein ComE-like DNA-binding protein
MTVGFHKSVRPIRRRRGAILVIAMWVVLVLGALVLVYARSMQVEAVASANRLCNVKAASIEHAAEQYVLCQVDGTAGDAVSILSIPGQAIQVGDGYFWLLRPNPADDKNFDFGIQDEASKININSASDDILVNVPDSTQEIADSIVTWRNTNGTITGQAGGTSYYESLPEPYDNKNGNFETVEELLMMQNTANGAKTVTKDILFGSDLNRNGVIDPGEGQAADSTGSASMAFSNAGGYNDSRGMFNFLTCYTLEPNTDPNGNPRINVNLPTSRAPLQTLLSQTLAPSRVSQVLSTVAGTGSQRQFKSIVAWYQASGLQPQEFGPIASYLTTSKSTTLTGMLNINTASSQALLCLPSVQQADADAIVSSRTSNSGGVSSTSGSGITMSGSSSNSTAPSGDLTWLFQAVSPQTAAAISPYITVRSFQYSADIVAVSGDGRSFRRARIVVDARTSPPVIVYRKDLTGYGWPLTTDIRTTMRKGSPPPIIQTTATTGTGGL